MPRILGASLLSLILIAACTATPAASPSPTQPAMSASSGGDSTAMPSVTIDSTPTPTASGPAGPSPTPRATLTVDCPAGPLTVAEFLAADRRCYQDIDVSVVGWFDTTRTDDPRGAELDHVLRGSMPFGALGPMPEDFVFVDESGAVPPSGWPDGAHWATVVGRGATGDRACHRDTGAGPRADAHCPPYLVATKVVESAPPDPELNACLSTRTMEEPWPVEQLTAYPSACFGSRDVTARGWFDIRYVITGWEAPWGIAPGWLWVPIGPWTVLAPTSNPDTSEALLVYVDPARGVDVRRTNRWVVLTGHYADPKAATCHVEYAAGFEAARDGERVPDSFARRQCEAHFVVTSIRDTTP